MIAGFKTMKNARENAEIPIRPFAIANIEPRRCVEAQTIQLKLATKPPIKNVFRNLVTLATQIGVALAFKKKPSKRKRRVLNCSLA